MDHTVLVIGLIGVASRGRISDEEVVGSYFADHNVVIVLRQLGAGHQAVVVHVLEGLPFQDEIGLVIAELDDVRMVSPHQ